MTIRGKVGFVFLCLAAACPSYGQVGNIVRDLQSTRSALPPIAAEYEEDVTVTNPDGGNGLGHHNSNTKMTCAIDANSSSRQSVFSLDERHSLDENLFASKGIFYKAYTRGRQGNFGSRPSGLINPIAIGFNFISEPMVDILKTKPVTVINPNTVDVQYNDDGKFQCAFTRLGNQLFVSKVDGGSKQYSNRQVIEVQDWLDVKGTHIPQDASITFYDNGTVSQVRKYKFLKLLPDQMKPLAWQWKEGATVKNTDTQKVYTVKHGVLVLDPRFVRSEATAVALRRLVVLFCFLGIGAWIFARLRSRPKAPRTDIKTQGT